MVKKSAYCRCSVTFLLKSLVFLMATSVSYSLNSNQRKNVQYVLEKIDDDSKMNDIFADSTKKRISLDSSFFANEENFHRVNEVRALIRNQSLAGLWLNVTQYLTQIRIDFQPSVDKLWDDNTVHVIKDEQVHNILKIEKYYRTCHYESITEGIAASVSNCYGTLEGIIIVKDHIFVLENSTAIIVDESNQDQFFVDYPDLRDIDFDNLTLPMILSNLEDMNITEENPKRSKRSINILTEDSYTHFCGVDKDSEPNTEPESKIAENAALHDSSWSPYSNNNHIVEMAVFVDQYVWERFYREYDLYAYSHLQDFVATTLNNVQIFYQHISFLPKINFKVVRYEVFKTQPYELRGIIDAEQYLNAFCNYQMRWGGRSWDQAIMFTGVDISRKYNTDRTISGIARMKGVCDPTNSCMIAEASNFRAAFITAHEMGHGLGMTHDEQLNCGNSFIMSESLGGGKVVWSSCSINDFHKFLNALNNENRNCMTVQNHNAVLSIQATSLPGQKYDSNKQCEMVFGKNYYEVKGQFSPQIVGDVCHMMWCHHRNGGILSASHPALEGTSCGNGRYCLSGKCVYAPSAPLAQINGGWSPWLEPDCRHCRHHSRISNSVAVVKSTRSCTNPSPQNGGRQCEGGSVMGVLCHLSALPVRQQQSLENFLQTKCTAKRREQNNANLLGTGAQLLHMDDRACKVFCVVNTPRGTKSFRFLGDYLPDGAPCGTNKYCLNNKCLPRTCGDQVLLPAGVACSAVPKLCPLSAPAPVTANTSPATTAAPFERFKWTEWSEWSVCSSACDSGVKTRTRQCYGTRTYKKNNGMCYGHEAEKAPCRGENCPVVRSPNWQQQQQQRWKDYYNKQTTTATTTTTATSKNMTPTTTTATTTTTTTEPYTIPTWKESYGEYSRWSEWSYCSVTCGEGRQYRYRTCRYSMQCLGEKAQDRPCYPKQCTKWGGWGFWSNCWVDRTRRRVRQCYGDQTYETCPGSSTDVENC